MKAVALRRCARVLNGGTPTADPAMWNGDVPWATPVDLARVDGARVGSTERMLTREGARTGSTIAPAGSVLVSSRAPIGYIAYSDAELAFNQGCKAVVPGPDLDSRFLQLVLMSQVDKLKAYGSGSTFAELSSEALASTLIPAWPMREQQRIANFLDDRVARINRLIESRSKQRDLLGEWLTSTYERVLGQFPSIPTRYLARGIGVGIVIQPARLYTQNPDGVPALRGLNVREGSFSLESLVRITPAGHSENVRSALSPGDVVVVRTGDAGSAAAVTAEMAGWNCIDLVLVRPRAGVLPELLAFTLNAAKRSTKTSAESSGSIQQHLGAGALAGLAVRFPAHDKQAWVLAELSEAREVATQMSRALSSSVTLLREYKKSLITAAVSGEIDVTAAGSGIPG